MNDAISVLKKGTRLSGRVYSYTIARVLGQGAFGVTYLAFTSMKGPLGEVTVQVALKEFFAKDLDTRLEDGTVSARTQDGIAYRYAKAFQRESENLSKMKHPGIVNVLEAFEAKGTYYYSMEYLSGGSLDEKVSGEGIPEQEALSLIWKTGEALAYMHERKVMHLDLKPKNIMLQGDDSPVIIDFGLSKQFDANGAPESSSTIGLGTPGYAPIEQGNQQSGRVFQPTLDIYALGATLYKMLTGSTPPTASDILNDGFPETPLQEKGVSAMTISAIEKAMSAARKDRPQSVAAFLALLDAEPASAAEPVSPASEETMIAPEPALQSAPQPEPKPVPEPKPAPKAPKSKPAETKKSKLWLWALLGGIAVAAIIAAIALGGGKDKPTPGGQMAADTTVVAPTADPVASATASVATTSDVKPEPETPGSAKIASMPSGATIWLDGKNTKKTTPDLLEDLKPGKHIVKLVLNGYEDYTDTVSVTFGEVDYAWVLKKKPANGIINGHTWVDLGLTVKWATCNMGASSPRDRGDYFAWGEIKTKNAYTWDNYRFRIDGDSDRNVILTKYNDHEEHGLVDHKTRLERNDDAARVNWGGQWRIPTLSEYEELETKCSWHWDEQDGIIGYTIIGKNGNSIFLPVTGYQDGSTRRFEDYSGEYWLASLNAGVYYNSAQAFCLVFTHEYHIAFNVQDRYLGCAIRPVTP